MTGMLYRMIYLSTANGAPEQEELEELMLRARANNNRDGITGLVAYHDYTFIQVLEGPEEKVKECFERIRTSDLHRNVFVAHQAHVEERLFDRYAMAFVPDSQQDKPSNTAFTHLSGILKGEMGERIETDAAAKGFLHAFHDTLRGL